MTAGGKLKNFLNFDTGFTCHENCDKLNVLFVVILPETADFVRNNDRKGISGERKEQRKVMAFVFGGCADRSVEHIYFGRILPGKKYFPVDRIWGAGAAGQLLAGG